MAEEGKVSTFSISASRLISWFITHSNSYIYSNHWALALALGTPAGATSKNTDSAGGGLADLSADTTPATWW